MERPTDIQSIASESAKAIVEQFLQTIPKELLDQLPQDFFEDTGAELQADIRACIDSRLRWTIQSAYAETLEQQRRETQCYDQPQQRINYSPPEPLQKLPVEKPKIQHQSRQSTYAATTVDNRNDPIETESYIEAEHYLTLKKKSPNRQRRRRRRSAAAEHQECLLNATS
ncbi:hypothetical protein [Acaryochloris sp. IP29b_bin.148]|uniref:hypothetical protein n=1 Tax=Acaryochloris sp. IP29b_bin.148 TaxID=2969218 RepID=UPI0026087917|nr:hypothetical protein [Acaryochloris sp. IP29b_bin.148]